MLFIDICPHIFLLSWTEAVSFLQIQIMCTSINFLWRVESLEPGFWCICNITEYKKLCILHILWIPQKQSLNQRLDMVGSWLDNCYRTVIVCNCLLLKSIIIFFYSHIAARKSLQIKFERGILSMLFTDHLKELIGIIQWYPAVYLEDKIQTTLVPNLIVLSIEKMEQGRKGFNWRSNFESLCCLILSQTLKLMEVSGNKTTFICKRSLWGLFPC